MKEAHLVLRFLPLTLYPTMPHNLKFIYNTQFRDRSYPSKSLFFFNDNDSDLSPDKY